jgi:ankyrin repeat protein
MKSILVFFVCIFAAVRLIAATNDVPVKLAIISESPDTVTVADVLTAEFTRNAKVQLLERSEIDRVYREQGFSAANKDHLKLGQILGSDGLLLLEPSNAGTNQYITTRLLAVKPGVIIGAVRSPWPILDTMQWAKWIASHFSPLIPKLGVRAGDAIPISVVNLRSSVQSPEGQELERQLTLLAIERFTQEKEFFVLERRRLDLLSAEKDLKGVEESPFWIGSFLLDGAIDRDGYSKETSTINARLTPPKGGTPFLINISGSRTNLADLINRLVVKVREEMKLGAQTTVWNAADEADQYFQEAKWAFRWRMFKEAQEACESSWALGKRTKEVADLRIRAYGAEAAPVRNSVAAMNPTGPDYVPDPGKLEPAIRSLQLFQEGFRNCVMIEVKPDTNWYSLSINLLVSSSELLRQFYYHPTVRQGHEERLAELRLLCRNAALLVETVPQYRGISSTTELFVHGDGGLYLLENPKLAEIEAIVGMYWYESPAQCLDRYRQLVLFGSMNQLRHYFANNSLIAWKPEELKQIPGLWQTFIQALCASTNTTTKVEGYFLGFSRASVEQESATNEEQLFKFMVDNATTLDAAGLVEGLLNDIENFYSQNNFHFSPQHDRAMRTAFRAFKTDFTKAIISSRDRTRIDLLKTYLNTNTVFDGRQFYRLFLGSRYSDDSIMLSLQAGLEANDVLYTESESREIFPLVNEYKPRILQGLAGKVVSQQPNWLDASNSIDMLEVKLKNALAKNSENTPTSGTPVRPAKAELPKEELCPTNVLQVARFWEVPQSLFERNGRYGADTSIQPGCRFRDGKMWLEVISEANNSSLRKAFIFEVDLDNFKTETIELPLENHTPDISRRQFDFASTGGKFEILRDFLYFNIADHIKRYSLRNKVWDEASIPVEGNALLHVFGDHLYISTTKSIMEMSEDGNGARILASTRRRPAVTSLDSFDNFGQQPPNLFVGPNKSLRTLISGKLYAWEPNQNQWSQPAIYPQWNGLSYFASSDLATIVRTTNSLMMLRDDQTEPELLFALPVRTRPGFPFSRPSNRRTNEKVALPDVPSQKPRWVHVPGVGIDTVPLCIDGEKLWFLLDDLKMMRDESGTYTLTEKAGRHALLLEFQKNRREARAIPLWFIMKDGLFSPITLRRLPGTGGPSVHGQTDTRSLGKPIMESTPQGIVVTAEHIPGFWLIPRKALEQQSDDWDPNTPLFVAAQIGDITAVKEILDRGIAVDARNYRGWTSLILAVNAGQLEMVKFLIGRKADVNAKSTGDASRSVLCFAAEGNKSEIAKELLEYGALPNATCENGLTALYIAAAAGNREVAEVLLSMGAEIDQYGQKTVEGWLYTPLMGAADGGHLELVELLLSKGAKLERRNNADTTVLMGVAMRPYPDILKLLIDKGANINAVGPDGFTPLILSVYKGQTENLKLLLAAGADLSAIAKAPPNISIDSPFDAATLARLRGNKEALALILEAQAKTGKTKQ